MVHNPIIIKSNQEGTLTLLNAKPLYRLSSSKGLVYLYAPFSTLNTLRVAFLLANGIEVPYRRISVSTEEIADIIPEGDIEEDYNLWEYPIPSAVLNSVSAKKASEFFVSFKESELADDPDYLGFYSTASEVTATINAELKVEFPTATTNQYVNVWQSTSNTFFSWLYDGADFIKQTKILNEIQVGTTGLLQLAVQPSVSSDDEEIDVTVTEIILNEINEINALLNQINNNYLNKDFTTYPQETVVDANDKLILNDKDTGEPKYTTVAEIVTDVGSEFTSVTLLNGATNEAVMTFDGTDITLAYQPLGTNETVNAEMFKNLFVQITATAAITAGQLIQYDGVIGVSGKVKGKPFVPSELNANPEFVLGIATQSGGINDEVLVNWYGVVNDLDTSIYTEGEVLYAFTQGTDGVDNGKLTNTQPIAPNAQIRIGATLITNPSNGAILVRPDFGLALSELHDVYCNGGVKRNEGLVYDPENVRFKNTLIPPTDIISGTVQNTFDLVYDSTQSNMRLTMKSGATVAYLHWSDRVEKLDVTDFRFTPNFGADTAPTENFMYLTKGATENDPAVANTNSSYPSEEYIPIGELSFFTEATTNAENPPGPIKNQNINNHQINEDLEGGYRIVTDYLRDMGVLYLSGLSGNGNLGTGALQYIEDDSGTFYIKHSSGVCRQFNKQQVMAFDTTPVGGDDMHVFNDFTTPYVRITNLNQITEDATGATIGFNEYFNVVINRIVNKTNEYCSVLLALPNGTYSDETDAKGDIDNLSVLDVPEQFERVYQPLAIITLRKKLGSTLEHVLTTDIRKSRGAGGAGGGGINDTSFFDNQFEIKNVVDNTKLMEFNLEDISTGVKRTLKPQDKDYVIADKADTDQNAANILVLQETVDSTQTEQTYESVTESTSGVITPRKGLAQFVEAQGLTLNSIVYQQDVVDTGTINFDSILGVDYYDWLNGVIIAGTGGNIVVTNNTGVTADMMVVVITGTPLDGKSASAIGDIITTYFEDIEDVIFNLTSITVDNTETLSFKENGNNVLLRSVGTARDKIKEVDNEWYKEKNVDVDTTVVKNTTTWGTGGVLTNTQYFTKSLQATLGYKFSTSASAINNVFLKIGNDMFKVVSRNDMNTYDGKAVALSDFDGTLFIRIETATASNTSEFETYLQANDVTFYYELATSTDTLLDKDGLVVQDDPTTLVQNSAFGTLYKVLFNIDLGGQVDTNTKNIQQGKKEVSTLEDKVETNTTNIQTNANNIGDLQGVELLSAPIIAETTESSASATTHTLSGSIDDYTAFKVTFIENSPEEAGVTLELPVVYNDWWIKKVRDISVVGGTQTELACLIERVSGTQIKVYNAALITNGTPTATFSGIEIKSIKGIK